MRLRAQDLQYETVPVQELTNTVGLTVDEALAMALDHVVDNAIPEDLYIGILDKLNDMEQNAFTMGLATEGIEVNAGMQRRRSSQANAIISQLSRLVSSQGCIYEDQYHDALYNQDNAVGVEVFNWVMSALIPLKRNPPAGTKKSISPEYKKKVLRQVKHPNVQKASYRARLGYSVEEGGYYARVVEAGSDISVAESSAVYADRAHALRVASALLSGVYRRGQETNYQEYLNEMDGLITRLRTMTDGDEAADPELVKAGEEIKRAIENFKNEMSKIGKRRASQEGAFLAEKRDLLKMIEEYHPQDIQKWRKRVEQAQHFDDVQQIWNDFYQLKNAIPFEGEEPRTENTFTEFIGLPQDDE